MYGKKVIIPAYANSIRQKRSKTMRIEKEEIKLSFYKDDMIA